MTAQYFTRDMTVDQIKAQYKNLAKTYHPDLNPATKGECTRIMAEINNQYEVAVKVAYKSESGDKYSISTEDALVNLAPIIDSIVTLPNIEIEICGSWVWVGGNTYDHRVMFNELGFKFSGNKVKWYYSSELNKGKKRGNYNMDQIRNKYGSVSVQTKRVA